MIIFIIQLLYFIYLIILVNSIYCIYDNLNKVTIKKLKFKNKKIKIPIPTSKAVKKVIKFIKKY
jgi:hypothetical protein